ncbi:hypothetical protein GCM10007860_17420 [Chitiniphilus shinanonensis]|uniref:Uncharacterized protein n=1 Tax=Chitiniphilus shinanonensis TaxID=553088 RepID=A0ABQ6BTQ8_9NEIS|nr:hypothetical protein [Chitiniphilus shinanonensis]GLS04595.1 hypothetical protein GCM10007860_17420 [Chitiniphilus shinanonensis]
MKRLIVELQSIQEDRLRRQIITLATEPQTLCCILAVSTRAIHGLAVTAVIVQDARNYLLRAAPARGLGELAEGLLGAGHPTFFLPDRLNSVEEMPNELLVTWLINAPPRVLTDTTLHELLSLARPNGLPPAVLQRRREPQARSTTEAHLKPGA